jgi:hypothetical protein
MSNDNLTRRLKDKIVEIVATTGRTPIAEIVAACAEIAEVKGEYDFAMLDRKNCVLWPGLCEEMVIAFHELVTEGRVLPVPVFGNLDLVILTFSAGTRPALPIAVDLPKRGFATRTWVPAVFTPPSTEIIAAMEREMAREASNGGGIHP